MDLNLDPIAFTLGPVAVHWYGIFMAVSILVGGNLGELGFTLAGTALGGSAPLNPRQLLLVNLLTDLAPALAIALREPVDRVVVGPGLAVHEAEVVDGAEDVVVLGCVARGGPGELRPHGERLRRRLAARVPGPTGGPDEARRPRVDHAIYDT